jgi:hypothetical protein
MKVTAILPDKLISEVQQLSHGKNITESLKIALDEWIKIQNLKKLNKLIKNHPLKFDYSAEELRNINRLQ